MTTNETTTWSVAPGRDLPALLAPITARHTTRPGPRSVQRRTYLDTFDGRVHRAGGSLATCRSGRRLELHWERGGQRVHASLPRKADFARELPDGELRSLLAPLVEVRRLLPLIEIESTEDQIEFVDRDDKVVARLVTDRLRARIPGGRSWRSLDDRVHLRPVRGYDLVSHDLARCLAGQAELAVAQGSLLEEALGAIGKPLPHDPCKVDVALAPGVRADVGLRRILRAYLDVIELNEPYVREDLDPEFLHDFRVAQRRSRALLGQLSEVLPEPTSRWAQDELRWLGTLTGPLRDADVLLERFDAEAGDLGVEPLAPLRSSVERQRVSALAALVRGLDSARYRRFVASWRRVVEEQPEDGAITESQARRPLREVAGACASRLYKHLRRQARELSPEHEGEVLHRIRLDGKKLRYVLDGCRRLYAPADVATFLEHLRKVQNALGQVQDCGVQSERIVGLATRGKRLPVASQLAVGRLVERLATRGARARRQALKQLRDFTARAERQRFAAMLDSRPGRGDP